MSTIKNLIHMVFPHKKATENEMENGTLHAHTPSDPPTHTHVDADVHGRPEISPTDQLTLFRHLTGISSHPSMAHTAFHSNGRPAPNLGIYARVVHNESTAKSSYKYGSWLINGCLGIQIVVAAALTAMGAAGASRSAVTVFGAINTVIAGILTFLKGSGLPNRLKYYQSEWKRVREFIEQRERDFSRPGCDLDVYGVVAVIEGMYDEVKMDLEASTPDRFAGARSTKAQQAEPIAIRPAALTLPRNITDAFDEKSKQFNEKSREFGEKQKEIEAGFSARVKDIASELGHMGNIAKDAAKDFQAQKTAFNDDANRQFREFKESAESRLSGPITINVSANEPASPGPDSKPAPH